MMADMIFDSLCRCFGVPDGTSTQNGATQMAAFEDQPQSNGNHNNNNINITFGRRLMDKLAANVLINDRILDPIACDENLSPYSNNNSKYRKKHTTSSSHSRQQCSRETDQAHELAKAKLASTCQQQQSQSQPQPNSQNQPRTKSLSQQSYKKRKSAETKRSEIFRSKDFERREKPEPPSNSFSRLLGSHQGTLVTALCFATPVHDNEEEEVSKEILKSDSDCNTLNTAEDTVTSTLFFERKYAHLVEHRPPMPLFSDFKVEDDQNELRRIVASDSHNSLKMIRLMEEAAATLTTTSNAAITSHPTVATNSNRKKTIAMAALRGATQRISLEESEDEDDDDCNDDDNGDRCGNHHHHESQHQPRHHVTTLDDYAPPAIQIDSSASSSSTTSRR